MQVTPTSRNEFIVSSVQVHLVVACESKRPYTYSYEGVQTDIERQHIRDTCNFLDCSRKQQPLLVNPPVLSYSIISLIKFVVPVPRRRLQPARSAKHYSLAPRQTSLGGTEAAATAPGDLRRHHRKVGRASRINPWQAPRQAGHVNPT